MNIEWNKISLYPKLVTVVLLVGVLALVFYLGGDYVSLPQGNETDKAVAYTKGQYIDEVGIVREYVQDCGGGDLCLNYLTVFLPEEKMTHDISGIRINIDSCVDETLRTGDTALIRGVIENVVPDVGLILSCDNPRTSITRKADPTESEYFAHIFNTIRESYPDIFSEMKREKFEWYIQKDPVSTPEVKEISGWGIETQNIFDSAELYDIFKYRLFFEQSLENSADSPREAIQGYIKNIQSNSPAKVLSTACLVTAISSPPPMKIKIYCGFLN